MLTFDSNRLRYKIIARLLLVTFLIQIFTPLTTYSQSNGESQVENTGGLANDMVDLFTGDFSYPIHLMDVEGFPITLVYNGDVTMNQEASWVGLGWSLNTGAINREMRGLPDDFDGDNVENTLKMLPMLQDELTVGFGAYGGIGAAVTYQGITLAGNVGTGLEINFSNTNNTYTGHGIGVNFNPFVSAGGSLALNSYRVGVSGSLNTSIGASTSGGISINNSVNGSYNAGIGFVSPIFALGRSQGVSTFNSTRDAKQKTISAGKSISSIVASSSFSGSSDITFGTRTYTPPLPYNVFSSSYVNGSKMGLQVGFPVGENDNVGGFAVAYNVVSQSESSTYFGHENKQTKAYGYLNLEKGDANSMLDFNRENLAEVNENLNSIHVSNLTYDVFRVSGIGGGFSFRSYRNDVGTVSSPNASVLNYGSSDFNSGTVSATVIGSEITESEGNSEVKNVFSSWVNSLNGNQHNLKFKGENASIPNSEKCYFKTIGEITPHDPAFFNTYGGSSPVSVEMKINSAYNGITTTGKLEYENGNKINVPTNNVNLNKEKRNTGYKVLSAKEASEIGFEKDIYSYSLFDCNITNEKNIKDLLTQPLAISRTSSTHKDHHISEITVINASGGKNIYNTPVYSIYSKDVMFNVSPIPNGPGVSSNLDRNTVGYVEGVDNTISNVKGREQLFQSTKVPSYSSSFLLRAVVSDDYNDITGDGLSEDDYGSYIKLNHTRLYGGENPFYWKSTVSGGTDSEANFIENNKSYNDDNLGQYSYGSKEVWYTHSIEGKNYVALFCLEDRKDMFSVNGANESGTLDLNKPGKLLKKIVLYNKQDLYENNENAVPIQTVHFEYDYSLCGNYIMNSNVAYDGNGDGVASENQGGKLTLKKVYITYGNSDKLALNPYEFNYNGTNEPYEPAIIDHWGVYTPENTFFGNNNNDFPYATMSNVNRNNNVASWSLTEIITPSSGKITIEYESDDYTYVQDRKAMNMYQITGFKRLNSDNKNDKLRDSKKKPRLMVYISTHEPVSSSAEFQTKYVDDIVNQYGGYMYYQALLVNKDDADDYELVKGFAKIDGWGYDAIDGPYIILEEEKVGDDDEGGDYDVNPISKSGWQHLRNSTTRAIFPDGIGNNIGVDLGVMLRGLNKTLNKKKFSYEVKLNASYVRLMNPLGYKYGGGNRVKSIKFYDNWDDMTGEGEFSYGVKYSYTTTATDELGQIKTISSGVVSNEPTGLGFEVNPFYQPDFYTIEKKKFPDDQNYSNKTLGLSHFSAPFVGYSKVKIESLDHSASSVTQNAVGYDVVEFFTAYDFPTISTSTTLSPVKHDITPTAAQLNSGQTIYKLLGLSQGFIVELNDMHGKIKKESNYNAFGNLITTTEYKYKTGAQPVSSVFSNEEYENIILGRDVDMVNDVIYCKEYRSNVNTSKTKAISLPAYEINTHVERSEHEYVLNSFTKVIHNYSLVDEVKTTHLGSTATVKNLVYDSKTGDVLVSSSDNQYDAKTFSHNVPAYWKNKGMGPAYQTHNNHFTGVNVGTYGFIDFTGSGFLAKDYFYKGDIILIRESNGDLTQAWVLKIDETNNKIQLIDIDGTPIPTVNNVTIRVIESGMRNMQFASMAQYSSLEMPTGATFFNPNKILDASVVEFSDKWKTPCDLSNGCGGTAGTVGITVNQTVNPFVYGILGNWRPSKSYAYQSARKESLNSTVTDLRVAGQYNDFTPFYQWYNGTEVVDLRDPLHPNYNAGNIGKWLLTSTVTEINKNGSPIEMVNTINNPSGVLYGYNNFSRTVPVAMASNANVGDIAFDGFEDYTYLDDNTLVANGHFDFSNAITNQLTTDDAHTGRYSVKIQPNNNLSETRFVRPFGYAYTDPYTNDGYVLQRTNCESFFNPKAGKYVFSAWVKQDQSASISRTDARVSIQVNDVMGDPMTSQVFINNKEENIIDGWQRFEFEFTIPSLGHCITISLINHGSTNTPIYYDDIRIHPFNSNMVTSVYDPLSLRKWADLDDFNFATFYEYDEHGFMVRVKQETYQGIRTIQEQRASLKKP